MTPIPGSKVQRTPTPLELLMLSTRSTQPDLASLSGISSFTSGLATDGVSLIQNLDRSISNSTSVANRALSTGTFSMVDMLADPLFVGTSPELTMPWNLPPSSSIDLPLSIPFSDTNTTGPTTTLPRFIDTTQLSSEQVAALTAATPQDSWQPSTVLESPPAFSQLPTLSWLPTTSDTSSLTLDPPPSGTLPTDDASPTQTQTTDPFSLDSLIRRESEAMGIDLLGRPLDGSDSQSLVDRALQGDMQGVLQASGQDPMDILDDAGLMLSEQTREDISSQLSGDTGSFQESLMNDLVEDGTIDMDDVRERSIVSDDDDDDSDSTTSGTATSSTDAPATAGTEVDTNAEAPGTTGTTPPPPAPTTTPPATAGTEVDTTAEAPSTTGTTPPPPAPTTTPPAPAGTEVDTNAEAPARGDRPRRRRQNSAERSAGDEGRNESPPSAPSGDEDHSMRGILGDNI